MIVRAEEKDLDILTELACRLWPEHNPEELRPELMALIKKKDAAFFLAREAETAAGFAQCQLRHDYVEGTEHSPVGYLEGIFVAEDFRGRGIAREMLRACEDWAKARGCTEFASDCELHNTQSLCFHKCVGFREANRIICFVKEL